jgi:hypothetical protein
MRKAAHAVSQGTAESLSIRVDPGPPLLLRLHDITYDARNVIRFRMSDREV